MNQQLDIISDRRDDSVFCAVSIRMNTKEPSLHTNMKLTSSF